MLYKGLIDFSSKTILPAHAKAGTVVQFSKSKAGGVLMGKEFII